MQIQIQIIYWKPNPGMTGLSLKTKTKQNKQTNRTNWNNQWVLWQFKPSPLSTLNVSLNHYFACFLVHECLLMYNSLITVDVFRISFAFLDLFNVSFALLNSLYCDVFLLHPANDTLSLPLFFPSIPFPSLLFFSYLPYRGVWHWQQFFQSKKKKKRAASDELWPIIHLVTRQSNILNQ